MNKKLIYLLALPFLLFACKKTSTDCAFQNSATVASAAEIAYIQTYLTNNGLTATQHSSGMFYTVTSAGSGSAPGLCSGVTVRYSGRTFNTTSTGGVFDSNTTGVSFTLGQLIVGWQKGIPLIAKGGAITLYIPPSLGYGSAAAGSIPANSYLVFTIQLDNVF
ncbi:MAG: FKBP-type peptidyl-prolyl cis-trans isomerase [Ferruginibacter sp.]